MTEAFFAFFHQQPFPSYLKWRDITDQHPHAFKRELTRLYSPQDRLVISNEARFRARNPMWPLVEQIIREVDTGDGNSFCCLEAPNGSYIQTLHGINGYHLEWRVSGGDHGYIHYRASYPGVSEKAAQLKKHDAVSSGLQGELLCLDDVIDAFSEFFCGTGLPRWLLWRPLDI